MADIAGAARPNTLHVYRSLLDRRILPAIGGLELAEVDSLTVKSLVGRLAEAHLSPATINLTVTLVKQVVKSAVDGRGNRLFPVAWNSDFIKAPRIDPDSQKTPVTPSQTLQEAITATTGEIQALVVILGATGLRIGECLALGLPGGNRWDREAGTLTITSTLVNGTLQPAPKTRAGNRVVDLHPDVNAYLCSQFANSEQPMFPMSEPTYRRKFATLGIHGFHSLRRFRVTRLQLANVPESLIKFWAGHAAKDVTARYTKVGSEIAARKEWSEKAGIGFQL